MKQEKFFLKLTLAVILLLLQVVSAAAIFIELFILDMLPETILAAVLAGFGVLLILTTFMILFPAKKGKKAYFRKGLGILLSLVLTVGCACGTFALRNVNTTVTAITESGKTQNRMVGVYVLASDPASSIEDIADYAFAMNQMFEYENSLQAQKDIETKLNSSMNISVYASVNEQIDALYSGDVNAILLSESYLDILTEQSEYKDFEEKTKLLYEVAVTADTTENTVPRKEYDEPIQNRCFIVYISGSDTRSNVLQTSRSDVNLLAVVNPKTQQILLLNTPRDYYIEISKAPGQLDKLTHCGIYGIDCSMRTLSNLYGQDIDYYAQINFTGFSTLIDALGGITVYNEQTFTSNDGINFPAGEITMGGTNALSFVRERKAFKNGDNQRGKNQMKVITAIIKKVKSSAALLTNYSDILTSLQGMFATNMTSEEMSDLVKAQLSDGMDWKVVSYSVTGSGDKRTTYSIPNKKSYVTIPDTSTVLKAKELIQKIYNGETLSEADAEA